MKLLFPPALFALLTLGTALSRDASAQEPPTQEPPRSVSGWTMRTGSTLPTGQVTDFQIGIDASVFHGGKASAFIKALKDKPQSFRGWGQAVKADAYRGKRVRLSGFLKTQNVADSSVLWMRVDGIDGPIAFDNMEKRPVKGTTDWQSYFVVLDVPKSAQAIHFGALLTGSGTVWIDDLTLETVDAKKVASTGVSSAEMAAQEKAEFSDSAARQKAELAALSSQGVDLGFEAAPATEKLVSGWRSGGSESPDYEYGFVTTEKREGNGSAFIKATADKPTGFRTWGQRIKADAYRGKRVQFTGYVKTDHVANWAGLWMNVFDADGKPTGFDNMRGGKIDRSLHGTADWQVCSIVLDVPKSAQSITFGALLEGSGTVWLDDFRLETVNPKKVAVTDIENYLRTGETAALPKAPLNLDFEQ